MRREPNSNEEEHIDGLKPDGIYGEKIARQDLFFVVCHQMTPAKELLRTGTG